MSQLSIFSSEELPANPLASPDLETDWIQKMATSPSNFVDYLYQNVHAGLFGKMCPASLVLSQVKQVVRIWKDLDPKTGQTLQRRQILQPSSQDFRNAGIVAPGVSLTLNISEWPRDGVVCSLSDILETTGDHLQRYCLTPKACIGILRRVDSKGKKLPTQLRQALENTANRLQPSPPEERSTE